MKEDRVDLGYGWNGRGGGVYANKNGWVPINANSETVHFPPLFVSLCEKNQQRGVTTLDRRHTSHSNKKHSNGDLNSGWVVDLVPFIYSYAMLKVSWAIPVSALVYPVVHGTSVEY